MTYKETVEQIKYTCLEHISVNSFRDGLYSNSGGYEINGDADIDYPVTILVPNVHTSRQYVVSYSFNLFYVDRLTDGRTNKTDVQSEAMQTLREIVNKISDNFDLDLDYNLRYTLFTERFVDECAGAYVTLNIEAEAPERDCYPDINKCNFCN